MRVGIPVLSVHAVDWLTGGEKNASLLLLELLASVIDKYKCYCYCITVINLLKKFILLM